MEDLDYEATAIRANDHNKQRTYMLIYSKDMEDLDYEATVKLPNYHA
jgi:hypothetical protein